MGHFKGSIWARLEYRTHPWAIDTDGAVSTAYNVRALETAVIIDREGRVVYTGVARTEDAVKQQLDKIL